MKIFFPLLLVVFVLSQETLLAQVNNLSGYWRMKNSAELSEINSLLRIQPEDNFSFTATFKRESTQSIELAGIMYDGNQMNAIENTTSKYKSIYSGKLQPDGTIQGTYFSANRTKGIFIWEKVCNDAGQPLNGYQTPCVQTPAYTTKMVTEVQQVPKTIVLAGEPRNENIPLGQPDTYIPPDAVYTGKIALDAQVVYQNVTVQTPVQVAVPNEMFKYTETSGAVEPITRFTAGANNEKLPLDICDTGTINPNAPKGKVEKGKTVKENGMVYHIVGKGETMYSISGQYGITIQQLADLNQKDCERLYKGEKLRVK